MARKRVAFQGERGAFSEEAAQKLLGRNITAVACESFETVFDAVEQRRADHGVIPIENSLIGTIQNNNDLLLHRQLHIIGETHLRIVHCLAAPLGSTLRKVRRCLSHPAALDQCRVFLKKHSRWQFQSFYDTAGAARLVAESAQTDLAAIASPYAARLYDLKVLRSSIEDEKFNFTRFLLLARRSIKPKKSAKTSIVFSLKNQPGVLFKALSVFALRDIDLTKIESRPSRKQAWQYNFFVDFIGSLSEDRVRFALDHLGEITHFVKVLGCYPIDKESR